MAVAGAINSLTNPSSLFHHRPLSLYLFNSTATPPKKQKGKKNPRNKRTVIPISFTPDRVPMVATAASILALAVAIIAIQGISGQAPAPGPVGEVDCFTTLLNMSDCLSYVTAGSNDTKPTKQCCSEMAGLVESSPKCLCELLSDPDKVGLTIDVDRALKLPSDCHVSTPPISLCSLLGFPVRSANSPASAPSPSPGVQPPDAGDSATTGTPGNNGNRASSIDHLHLAFPLGLALAFISMLL